MMSDPTKSIANDCLKNGKTSSSDEDLQSLSQLADQPQKLHRTLFRMIEKKQIKKMLPPSLKVSWCQSCMSCFIEINLSRKIPHHSFHARSLLLIQKRSFLPQKMKTSAVKQLCLEKLEQISKKSIVKMIVGGKHSFQHSKVATR